MSSVVGGGLVRVLFGAGMGLTTAPATESIMGSLPLGKAGVGSAVNDTTRQTGGALGVAVLGSLFLFRYRSIIGDATAVPERVRDELHDSVGKGLAAARTLSGAARDTTIELARDAFVSAMRPVYLSAAAVVLAAAAVAWRYLPGAGAHGRRRRSRAGRGAERGRRVTAAATDGSKHDRCVTS